MTRNEHLQWAKTRALEYVEQGLPTSAMSSFMSDLIKHDALLAHPALKLGMGMLAGGLLDTPEKVRDFIQGAN